MACCLVFRQVTSNPFCKQQLLREQDVLRGLCYSLNVLPESLNGACDCEPVVSVHVHNCAQGGFLLTRSILCHVQAKGLLKSAQHDLFTPVAPAEIERWAALLAILGTVCMRMAALDSVLEGGGGCVPLCRLHQA